MRSHSDAQFDFRCYNACHGRRRPHAILLYLCNHFLHTSGPGPTAAAPRSLRFSRHVQASEDHQAENRRAAARSVHHQRGRKTTSAVGANDATGSSAPGAAACADAGPIGVRVGLRRRGCSGLSYRLEYVPSAASIDKLDCVVEAHGVTVVVDRAAVMFLVGTTMDFTTTALGCEFVFSNPNQETACGCGQSFNLRPAQMIPAEGNTP
eukprot:GHVT01039405.1.p1 GENE.GHVT01039405.1~~GHVT01039405.1.p1  ORF type:complete len:208 (+),score=43.46 GHVT01039405.1:911-1534(+)